MKRELVLFTAKVAIVVAAIVIIGMITGGYELRLELCPKAKKKEPKRERDTLSQLPEWVTTQGSFVMAPASAVAPSSIMFI